MSYTPFYRRFSSVAEKETRSLIIVGDPDLPDDKYVFTEAYCNDQNCDCRRVFFNVFSEKTEKFLAVITYGWDTRKYYIDWMGEDDPAVIDTLFGLSLNLASPQSDLAHALLRKIDMVLKNDIDYVKRLKEHYKIFRAEIDKEYKKIPNISKATTGRNDPCPCGTGKKFKQCCLN